MLSRLAGLALLADIAACDAPPRDLVPKAPPPAVQVGPAVAPSLPQLHERSEQCGKSSREVFERDWNELATNAAQGTMTVDFTNHYNAKLDTCFYLLTVSQSAAGPRKLLFDVNEREPYGEYRGSLPGSPGTCRVEDLYCASSGEWDVLVLPYMED